MTWMSTRALGPLLVLGLGGCSTVEAIGDVAVAAGRRMLVERAQENYGGTHSTDLGKVLDILMVQNLTEGGEAPPPSTTPGAPLEFELAVVREVVLDGRATPIPVEDGAVLRDGVGRAEPGDNLRVQFEVSESCYVYAIWIDATAWATPIYPVGPGYELAARVPGGQTITVPGGGEWFFLDGYRGVENLYFVASREPLAELDVLVRALAGKERPPLEDPVSVDEPAEATRGIGGTRPGATTSVQGSDGATHLVASQTFVSAMTGGDLVVTRWFRHE